MAHMKKFMVASLIGATLVAPVSAFADDEVVGEEGQTAPETGAEGSQPDNGVVPETGMDGSENGGETTTDGGESTTPADDGTTGTDGETTTDGGESTTPADDDTTGTDGETPTDTGTSTETEGSPSTSNAVLSVDDVHIGLRTGGLSLSVSDILDFQTIKIESDMKTHYTKFDVTTRADAAIGDVRVTDSRGLGEGWHVTLSATPFTEVQPDGKVDGLELPLGSFTFDPASATVAHVGTALTSNPLPTIGVSTPTAIDAGEITVLSAVQGEGDFEMNFTDNVFGLTIDATTAQVNMDNYANGYTPYQSTVTWSIVSDPSGS